MMAQMRYFSPYIIVCLSILVIIGQHCSVSGQTSSVVKHIVINEADINPVGDDSRYPIDWVELYNPTNSSVNVGGWTVSATTGLRQAYVIPSGTVIQGKQFSILTYGPMWFPHAGAVIQLKDSNGVLVDQTPPLTDLQGGGSWQRIYDGYDTGSQSDWVYKTATPGSSNGQIPTSTATSVVTMSISTDKTNYIFGDTVIMGGKVSKLLTDVTQGYPLPVNIAVTGPDNFGKIFTVYPDNNLQFSTSMKTSQVTGFSEGNYTISASYGSIKSVIGFSISSTSFVPPPQPAAITLSITTDQHTYTPLQTITLLGNVSQVIPLTPVVYKVFGPNGTTIYEGNLYPDSQGHFTTFSPYQSHSSSSGIMIDNINPQYGLYTISATYGIEKSSTSFTIVPQQVQTTPIIVSTDKQAYGLGDTVHISGRTQLAGLQNSGLSPTLEIIQSSAASMIRGIVPQTLDIKTFVNVKPDNTFTYDFAIPSDSSRFGNYRAIITTPSAKSEADFVVVENPNTYQPSNRTGPITLETDKSQYAYGDPIVISGQVQANLMIQGVQVQISVFNSTGGQLYSKTSFISGAAISQSTPLSFSAYPDSSGNYMIKQSLTPGMFTAGVYTLKATYGNLRASATFSVYDQLGNSTQGPITASLDKQVYGVGETVHLTGKLSSSTGTSSYGITLLKPDGGIISAHLMSSNGLFNWNWTVPSQATFNTASTFTTNRASSFTATSQTNLYGIYRITLTSDYGSTPLFFQVSQNPQNQTVISPFIIETDKQTYSNSDIMEISGQALPQSNTASQASNNQVQLAIYTQSGQEIYRYGATLNQGGQFHVSVPMQPGIWPAGTYRIYAQYLTYGTNIVFQVTNPYAVGTGPLTLLMTTDRAEYLPGQTVLITGRTSNIISIDNVYLTIGLANDTVVSEGQVVSKKGISLHQSSARFDQYGSFSYDYVVPKTAALGNYTVVAQVPFGNYFDYYQVVDKLPVVNMTSATNASNVTVQTNITRPIMDLSVIPMSVGPVQRSPNPSMFVNKAGMLSSSLVTMNVGEKTINNQTFYPREIDGLLRLNPGDESLVSLKVTSPDGTCVIGSDPTCLVAQANSQQNSLYQSVELGNHTLLVGYVGQGQRVQQFSIIPTLANDSVAMGPWHVAIIKNNQVSRFYYQVTYLEK